MNRSFRCILLIIFFNSFILRSYSDKGFFNDKINTYLFLNSADTLPSSESLNFFVSNRGSDSNDGRSANTPKLKISSIKNLLSNAATGGSFTSLNLDESSLFREQYDPVNNNSSVTSFGLNNPKKLAKITGMDIIKDWEVAAPYNTVYQRLLSHSIDVSAPAYNYIMVAEIDTVLEKTRPVSAVKYLALVANIEQCNASPASCYIANVTTNPIMVYIHPTEGVPGKNRFRYEVTSRNYNINGFNTDNATFQNLFLQTSGNGYGMLSAGKNSLIRNSIFQGGGTHHTVIKSGTIDSCLFLPGPKGLADGIAAVFYNAEGRDGNNKITNTIFLGARNPVYTHTNGSVNHKSLVINNVYAFADTTAAINGLSANDTDSIDVSNCYVEGYPTGWYGGGTKLSIRNSVFRNTNQSAILIFGKANVNPQVTINNVLIKTNGNDQNQNAANGWTAYGVRSVNNNISVEMSNTIIHAFSTWHGPYQTVATVQVAGFLKAHHNIYICDVNDNNSVYMYQANNSGGRGTSSNISSDYNAFILLRGSKFNWMVNPNNNNDQDVVTLSEWQSLTGQDKNSLFIDLRKNPLGLKAIFVDPDNGNYTLAQTIQADSVRKLTAGNTNPPMFYPNRPLLDYDGIPFKTPGGFSTFNGTMTSESESLIKWQTFNESEFSSFSVEYSLDGTHFIEAGSLKALNNTKNNNYQYVHMHDRTDSIFYRLKCIYADNTTLYGSAIKLYSDFSQEFKITVYPNPFQQNITVEHPRRDLGEIRIYDYVGRLLKITIVKARASHTLLSLSSLPAGRYFVQWSSNQEKLSGMIVK